MSELPILPEAYVTKQTKARRKAGERARCIFVSHFPLCFAAPGELKKPLKIGIGEDICLAIPELSRDVIAAGLEEYTYGAGYCLGLHPGAARFGLDGQPYGHITQQEWELAQARLGFFAGQRR